MAEPPPSRLSESLLIAAESHAFSESHARPELTSQETRKDPKVEGSRSQQRAVTDHPRVHAKGVVLCERACFCLLSTF